VLAVYGIWIDPETGTASYDVGDNYDFHPPAGLPLLDDLDTLLVERGPTGWLTVPG